MKPAILADDADQRVPFRSALLVAIGTSVLFMLFYGGAAYITSLRTDVGTWYNLCPSMHIALRTVLAAHFGKHCRGPVRVLMNVWFFLIGCSTLLLYQHHVIDVVTYRFSI